MTDNLYWLNREFAKEQMEKDSCSFGNCKAPKITEIPLENGLPIAACAYHDLKFIEDEDVRENIPQSNYGHSFEEIEEAWEEAHKEVESSE